MKFSTFVKVLSPTSGFSVWGSGKGTGKSRKSDTEVQQDLITGLLQGCRKQRLYSQRAQTKILRSRHREQTYGHQGGKRGAILLFSFRNVFVIELCYFIAFGWFESISCVFYITVVVRYVLFLKYWNLPGRKYRYQQRVTDTTAYPILTFCVFLMYNQFGLDFFISSKLRFTYTYFLL